MDTYAQDGVNVSEGDKFSAFAGRVCRASFENSPYIRVMDLSQGYFRGVRSWKPVNLPDDWSFDTTSDGNGTKVIVSDAARMHRYAAHDLVSMCCMDITRHGGLPVVFNNDLNVRSLGEVGDEVNTIHRGMIEELGEVARLMQMVLFRGETAEVGVCVGSENTAPVAAFNWSGTAIGVYLPQLMITGDSITAGDIIMALREHGLRANGYSSVRTALRMVFGPDWAQNPDAQEHLQQAALPSVIYDPLLNYINGWHSGDFQPLESVHRLIHLTGGSFEGKLGADTLFPRGLSADLYNLWDPPEIMRRCQEWRGMSDKECYKTFNCGQGALAIVSPGVVDTFSVCAAMFGIEAEECGKVVKKDSPEIRIDSKFHGDEIIYTP